jgi:sugar O-acyltransferase (sialic acid O-acetyltransferase NeuD family)
MRDIVIYGGGGFAREVLQVLLDINAQQPTWKILGFLVDKDYREESVIQGLPVLGGAEWLAGKAGHAVVVANGESHHRLAMVERLDAIAEFDFPVLIHPRAWLGRNIKLGPGCIVCAGVAMTTDIYAGMHVNINVNATVGHDCRFEDFATVSHGVNVSGNVRVGEGVELLAGSVVIPHVKFGSWSKLAAGAVALSDIPPQSLAVGAPARVVKQLDRPASR